MSNFNHDKPKSNYDIFKANALKKFLEYDHDKIVNRLNLNSDENYIYIEFFNKLYRVGRHKPVMEHQNKNNNWCESDCNAVLTICDLLCHTEDPIQLSGELNTLQGLNTVHSSSTSGSLGDSFFSEKENFFNEHLHEIAIACEAMGGIPAGKGDLAYSLPLYGDIRLQFSFYKADDEFPATLTFYFDTDICKYLFYETLWYLIILVLEELTK